VTLKQRNAKEHSPTTTVLAYSRVSSKDQEREGYSIPAQQELLRNYAHSHGFTIAEEFVDVETAKQTGRTGFGQMIAHLKSHPNIRVILVEKTDRLYRNLKDYVTIDDLSADIHLVKEAIVLSPKARSSDKFMHGIRVLMAKNYIDNLSEETRKGMLEKARQGMWPSYAPLGYLNVLGTDGKRTIALDPERAPLIRRLFEDFSTGNHSLKSIANLSYLSGLRLRKSGARTPISTLHKILRNRIYTGDFDFDGVTYSGKYEAIITRELWNQVQDVLDGRNAKKTRRVKDCFAFSGLITCGHCGCAMVGEIKKGRYTYYHCTGYKQKCPEPYTREEVLEGQFTDLLTRISFTPEVLGWVKQALRESHGDEKRFHDDEIVRLQREGQRIQDRIDAMYLDKLDGRIAADFFDRKAVEWRKEQSRLEQEVHAHRNANRNYIDEGVRLLDLAQRASALFEKQPPREKRRLLDFVLSNCQWKNGELMTQYRQPFDLLAGSINANSALIAAGSIKTAGNENWLPGMDSNHDSRLQRPLSYH
jgi:site-specific DNA recombinase